MNAKLPTVLYLASGVLILMALFKMGEGVSWGELFGDSVWPISAGLGAVLGLTGRWWLSRLFRRWTPRNWSTALAHGCLLALAAGFIGVCQIGMAYEPATSTKDSFWFSAFVMGLPFYVGVGLMLVVDILRAAASAALRLSRSDHGALLQ